MANIMTNFPWKRLWKVGKPFWVSEKRYIALLHLFGVVSLLAANSAVAIYINFTAGRFTTAFESKNLSSFHTYLMLYVLAFVVGNADSGDVRVSAHSSSTSLASVAIFIDVQLVLLESGLLQANA